MLTSIALVAVANGLVIPQIKNLQDVFSVQVETVEQKKDTTEGVSKPNSPQELSPSSVKTEGFVDGLAPLVSTDFNTILGKYIIVLKTSVDVDTHLNSLTALSDIPTIETFVSNFDITKFAIDTFSGYSGYFPDSMISLLRRNPQVAFIERDSKVFANEFEVQNGSPWGLARISHRERLTLGTFNKYLYDNEGGEGVTAYVIDTGVSVTHNQFEGRAKWGKTIPLNDADIDGNGHGTHCAGTIGSKDYGVAKKAKIVAVKVLKSNGSGTMADVIKGVEFAANSHIAESKSGKKGFKGSTANMSLGGGKSPALDLAVNASVKAGLHFAVAAGNENQDACNTSPAAAENAITVGASTLGDTRAYFSNYGKCVDIFAPGLNVLSTYIGSDDSTATLSGTSMASPHICGLLTYFLSLYPDSDSGFSSASAISPAQLKKNLIAYGTDGILSDIPDADTPNILAFNGAGGNLTEFWAAGSSSSKVSDSKFKITQEFETKLDSLVQNLEEKLEGKAKEIENLINELL